MAAEIVEQYLSPAAEKAVNVDSHGFQVKPEDLETPSPAIFNVAQFQVGMMAIASTYTPHYTHTCLVILCLLYIELVVVCRIRF